MIRGIVSNNKPLITIVAAWELGVQELVVLVDTGFTGDLKVSPETVAELGLDITHAEPVSLANDETITMRASIAFVSMEGETQLVSVLIGKGSSVIGVGLLKRFGYVLTINFLEGSLTLEHSPIRAN